MRELTPDRLLQVLTAHQGAEQGCNIRQLVREATDEVSPPASLQRTARRIVEQLRLKGYHIGSHPSTGYFIAQTPEELGGTIEFLRARAMASLAQIAAMKRVSLPDLLGQLHLPT